jgi:predicted MFS family arabinose efflux permease
MEGIPLSDLLKFPRLIILWMLISLATCLAVLFTPALPEISQAFHLLPSQNQWTMTSFLFGFSFGPLIYGPLGNRFGRKKSILYGLGIAIIGSALSFFAPSFWILCLGRVIQGLGAAVGLKITFTMVGDLHVGQSATKVLSLLLLGLAIAPSVGIAIGGFITVSFGWRGCLAFMFLYTILLWLLCLTLPETAKHLDPKALQVRKIIEGYLTQFKNPLITLHGLLMGLSITILYVFSSEAPFIAIDLMGLTPEEYGLFSLLLPLGMCLALIAGNRLAGKLRPRVAMLLGTLVSLAGVLIMAFWLMEEIHSGWSLFLPHSMILLGMYFLWLFASTEGLSQATDKSNASAVMQFINLGCATLGTFLIGVFVPKEILTLPIVFLFVILAILAVWCCLGKQRRV